MNYTIDVDEYATNGNNLIRRTVTCTSDNRTSFTELVNDSTLLSKYKL